MKNVFLVISKEKIYAYVVSVLTILTLFFMSGIMKNELGETKETSSNIIKIENEMNCVENVNIITNIDN